MLFHYITIYVHSKSIKLIERSISKGFPHLLLLEITSFFVDSTFICVAFVLTKPYVIQCLFICFLDVFLWRVFEVIATKTFALKSFLYGIENLKWFHRKFYRFRRQGSFTVSNRRTYLVFLSTLQVMWKIFQIYRTFLRTSGSNLFLLECEGINRHWNDGSYFDMKTSCEIYFLIKLGKSFA